MVQRRNNNALKNKEYLDENHSEEGVKHQLLAYYIILIKNKLIEAS